MGGILALPCEYSHGFPVLNPATTPIQKKSFRVLEGDGGFGREMALVRVSRIPSVRNRTGQFQQNMKGKIMATTLKGRPVQLSRTINGAAAAKPAAKSPRSNG